MPGKIKIKKPVTEARGVRGSKDKVKNKGEEIVLAEELKMVKAVKKAQRNSAVSDELMRIRPEIERKRRVMYIGVSGLAILILIGWFFVFKYSISRPTNEARGDDKMWVEEKEKLADTWGKMQKNVAALKEAVASYQTQESPGEEKIKLTDEQIKELKEKLGQVNVNGWLTLVDNENGFTLDYPASWQKEVRGDSITFSSEKEEINLIIQKEIPRVPLPPELVEELDLGAVKATLYHDKSMKDGAPVDKLIFTLPKTGDDFYLAGYGETFNQMIKTLKLIQ